MSRLKSVAQLLMNLFKKPDTVRESFGFLSDTFRWLPRRDADKCSGCGACYERCSSGATSLTDTDRERLVSIDSLNCIYCGRCADICPEKALELTMEAKTEEERKAREEILKKIGKKCDVCVQCLRCLDDDPEASNKYVKQISLGHSTSEKKPTVDTTLRLQKCSMCGEIMPVTEKHLMLIRERTLANLQPDTAKVVDADMKMYLTACIACRQKHSLDWGTHPRKFI
jgi:hydrogenase-4 component H